MSDSFWAGGSNAYAKQLRKEYKGKLRAFKKQRKSASGNDLAEIDRQIAELKSEFKAKREAIGKSLF